MYSTDQKIVLEFDLEFEVEVELSFNSIIRIYEEVAILQLAAIVGVAMIFYSLFFVWNLNRNHTKQMLESMNLINNNENMI